MKKISTKHKSKTIRLAKIKRVEQATLGTFQEEIPSIYFSDKSEKEFRQYTANVLYMYRDLFKFPPKMFANANLIDFGAGTGENTISLARWGAKCTLVEMNDQALAIAKKVFKRYSNGGTHKFIKSSIFDYDSSVKYDIVHCRGVLSHTADNRGAFKKIAKFLKPGGFLIFGDPNKAGGFQNMLQRFAVYHYAKSPDDMVDVCEKLFKEDIDRSQVAIKRTRRAIIFDRWVIQSQDDPSVAETLKWLKENNLKLYSSYPPFLMPVIGDSVHHKLKFDVAEIPGMPALAETVWLLQKDGDLENVKALGGGYLKYSKELSDLTSYVANFNSKSQLNADKFNNLADAVDMSFEEVSVLEPLQTRLSEFIKEAKQFVYLVKNSDLHEVKAYIDSCKHLFKGACGVRHVDFIAYKTK
ncbi:MAG: class I SAM-dependent methyltransferase [Candidatus Yanofskybacteria bacterium]|nr:class I SAM-dependent methyltransferase [Candidatus Yanofskybacteria bacterium]